jgi:hypothetical protein
MSNPRENVTGGQEAAATTYSPWHLAEEPRHSLGLMAKLCSWRERMSVRADEVLGEPTGMAYAVAVMPLAGRTDEVSVVTNDAIAGYIPPVTPNPTDTRQVSGLQGITPRGSDLTLDLSVAQRPGQRGGDGYEEDERLGEHCRRLLR